MAIPGIDDQTIDQLTFQMMALDDAIATAEAILADADKGIEKLIERRGKLAKDVQHLWNHRHILNQKLTQMRDKFESVQSSLRYR